MVVAVVEIVSVNGVVPPAVNESGWGEGLRVGIDVAPAGLEVTVEVTVTGPAKLNRLVRVTVDVAEEP